MSCFFCGSLSHARNNCVDTNILNMRNYILTMIETKYQQVEHDVLRNTLISQLMYLSVFEIKIVLQHYKNIIQLREQTNLFINFPTIKEEMIISLVGIILREIQYNENNRQPSRTITGRLMTNYLVRPTERARHEFDDYQHRDFVMMRIHSIPPPRTIITPTAPQVIQTDKLITEDVECPICYNKLNDDNFVYLNCNHEYCKDCIKQIMVMSEHKRTCPMCRCKINIIYVKNVENYTL
jgi:hypothetical protein